MSKHHFSFKEVFLYGWSKTLQHAWFIFLSFIIISIIISATFLNPILNMLVAMMLGLSLASISLMISRNHAFTFGDLFYPLLSPRRVLKFFALFGLYVLPMLLVSLAVAIVLVGTASGVASVTSFGLVLTFLFFVPSFYACVRFKFFPYIVAEHEHSSVKDLVLMSYKLTENNFGSVLLFMVFAILLNLAGLLAFGVGLFVTIPTTLFASAHLYDKFKNHAV